MVIQYWKTSQQEGMYYLSTETAVGVLDIFGRFSVRWVHRNPYSEITLQTAERFLNVN